MLNESVSGVKSCLEDDCYSIVFVVPDLLYQM